ncbi:hypothetical protein [Hoeflea halophila]|nr:hypothetical protein [Hoeflea halophila]
MNRLVEVAVVAGATLFQVGVVASEESFWTIPLEKAQCILEHATSYADQGADPVVIIVDACPEVHMAKALASTAVNTGTMTMGHGDSVLIFSLAELKCLSELEIKPDEHGLVKISKALNCG